MSPQDVVIIGAGGFAREVLDVFDAVNGQAQLYNVLGYIVEPAFGVAGTLINDKAILGGFEWFTPERAHVVAICGVGAPEVRFRLIKMAAEKGVRFCSIVHPNVVRTRWLAIGSGTVITAGCILTNQIRIGNHVHINLDCTLGHDVIVEDFATVAPGVHISGNVSLKHGCYIGTGANILEKRVIGEWSIVGAGSTIVNDVPDNTTVVGVPGKTIKTRPDKWYLS